MWIFATCFLVVIAFGFTAKVGFAQDMLASAWQTESHTRLNSRDDVTLAICLSRAQFLVARPHLLSPAAFMNGIYACSSSLCGSSLRVR